MGDVKIPYYITRARAGRPKLGFWSPCLARPNKVTGVFEPTLMAKLGFKSVPCGEDGPAAWAIAAQCNARWKAALAKHRAGEPVGELDKIDRVYLPDTFGEAFMKYRATETWKAKKPRTREGWERGWRHIEPWFGNVKPWTVMLQHVDGWYAMLLETTTVQEAYFAMKIWRAMWRVIGTVGRTNGERYCDPDGDPSLGIRRKTPAKRNQIWVYDEARLLVKSAWRMGYTGLAAALAVSWDTMLSPVDVRSLTTAQLSPRPQGPLFSLARAKTGKAAIGTISRKSEKILARYIASLPVTLHPDMPIFHTRGHMPGARGGKPVLPRPYTKDTLGDDFRAVREAEFPGDKRTIMDFRRSGAVEATAGQVDQNALAGKMANSIDTNRALQATYQPNSEAVVRLADEARARGRTVMRDVSAVNSKGPKK